MKYNSDEKNRRMKARKDILTYIGYDAATTSFSAAAEAFCCKAKSGQLPTIVIETLAEAMQRHHEASGVSVRTIYYWKSQIMGIDDERDRKKTANRDAQRRTRARRKSFLEQWKPRQRRAH